MTAPCPQPTKSRYATLEAATKAAHRVTHQIGLPLRPYECPCTWWHLTKTPAEPIPNAADATPHDIQRLTSLPDIDFRAVVAADAQGSGAQTDRAALRHHLNLTRWKRSLGQLEADLNLQFGERKGDKSLAAHDWRRRATGYRESITLRLNECRRLKAEADAELHRTNGFRKRDAEIAAAAGATVQEMRRRAGEVAVGRLIAAHHPEFTAYLVDAYTELGINLPNRVRKYLPAGTEAAPADEESAS